MHVFRSAWRFGLCLVWVFVSLVAGAERPNIVVILTDDMGFSDLGCFGGEIETPHLDRLASGGLRFTEFYNTARCWPTRATLMSGRYSDGLGPSQVTVAEVLRQVGYQTAMVGKWHLGLDPKKNGPVQRGFDLFYGTLSGAGSFWDPPHLVRQTEFVDRDGADYYYTDKIGVEAALQIERLAQSDRPFFQYVAFTAAHWPLHAPEETVQKYIKCYERGWDQLRQDRYARLLELGIIDLARWPLPEKEPSVVPWETVSHKAWHVRNMALYAAMVEHMDRAVGRMVAALRDTNKLNNTLILYCHDNGACSEHLSGDAWSTARNVIAKAKARGESIAVGDHYDVPMGGPATFGSVGRHWAHAQNTPLRRFKANVHNGGVVTPAIVHWPAGLRLAPGSLTEERGHVVDLMATCLELGGATYPSHFRGQLIEPHESRSLAPILRGETLSRDYAYLFRHGGTHAVVQGDYKIVREGRRAWALYNLVNNRTETIDLALSEPERVARMETIWNARWGRVERR